MSNRAAKKHTPVRKMQSRGSRVEHLNKQRQVKTMSTQCTTHKCADITESLHLSERAACSALLNSGNNHTNTPVQRWLTSIKRFVVERYKQHLDRLAFRKMLSLNEHLLKDIGITRADVMYATKLPLSVDAAKEVESIARRNGPGRKH